MEEKKVLLCVKIQLVRGKTLIRCKDFAGAISGTCNSAQQTKLDTCDKVKMAANSAGYTCDTAPELRFLRPSDNLHDSYTAGVDVSSCDTNNHANHKPLCSKS